MLPSARDRQIERPAANGHGRGGAGPVHPTNRCPLRRL